MPRGGPLIADDFILPALNNETYGDTLRWINQNEGLFHLKLVHKNNSQWNEDYTRVFQDWDRMKGRSQNCDTGNGYLTDAKQRFKNAMRKCRFLEEASESFLAKFGLQRRKQILYFLYKKNNAWKHEKDSRKGKSALTIRRVMATFRDLKDTKELNYSLPKHEIFPKPSVIKHTNNIGKEKIYTVTDSSNSTESKQDFIRFNLPSNLSNGQICIKVPSNVLQRGSATVNLVEDHQPTNLVAAKNGTACVESSFNSNFKNIIKNNAAESVIKRVERQPALSNWYSHQYTMPLKYRQKGIVECVNDEDSSSSSSSSSDGENKLVIVDFDMPKNDNASVNFNTSKDSLSKNIVTTNGVLNLSKDHKILQHS